MQGQITRIFKIKVLTYIFCEMKKYTLSTNTEMLFCYTNETDYH